jgi:hypothetical protein
LEKIELEKACHLERSMKIPCAEVDERVLQGPASQCPEK